MVLTARRGTKEIPLPSPPDRDRRLPHSPPPKSLGDTMLTSHIEDQQPVTVCARALVVEDGLALMVRNHAPEIGYWYVLPGGKQHRGERLDETACRETREETGMSIRVGALWCVWEYLPERNTMPHGQPDQQIHFVFHATRQRPSSSPGTREAAVSSRPDARQHAVEWVPLRDVTAAQLYPGDLAARLREPDAVTREHVYLGDMC
ncbi:NUDIX domain-containing protein [Streptomyces huasconensis]|uniref:NUDIX domain-containing protein n=1 Tax=Streptomyces huasconensis TaxID=1854574 RepID=UPI0033E7C483